MASGLTSAKVKLVRAAKQIRALKRRIAAYARAKPHKIVKKAKGKKKLNVPKSPPIEIALLAGEIVYHMRSALDHLVFDVIKRNPNISTIDPNWEERSEFPLWTKPLKAGQSTPLPKSKFARMLPGIADAPFAFIESVQPYYGVGAVNNALRFLAHLSNIDKHRRLNFTRPRIRQYESVRYAHGLSSSGYSTLDRGAEINPAPAMRPLSGPIDAQPQKPVYVKRHYRPLVAFNERPYIGEATGLTMDHLLELILEQIETVIVPAFEKFIKKP
ncbi:MAG TPA: hypothetical protein VKA07_01385 [Candidatus Sulfotelmatobacter sp.]|nr:hypothetical protein [Candidatus Sulfotelmatobacter sp.]